MALEKFSSRIMGMITNKEKNQRKTLILLKVTMTMRKVKRKIRY